MLIFDEVAPAKRKMLLIERPLCPLPPPYLGTIVVTGEAIRSAAAVTSAAAATAGSGSIESHWRSGYGIGSISNGGGFNAGNLAYYGRSYSMNNFQRFGMYK